MNVQVAAGQRPRQQASAESVLRSWQRYGAQPFISLADCASASLIFKALLLMRILPARSERHGAHPDRQRGQSRQGTRKGKRVGWRGCCRAVGQPALGWPRAVDSLIGRARHSYLLAVLVTLACFFPPAGNVPSSCTGQSKSQAHWRHKARGANTSKQTLGGRLVSSKCRAWPAVKEIAEGPKRMDLRVPLRLLVVPAPRCCRCRSPRH